MDTFLPAPGQSHTASSYRASGLGKCEAIYNTIIVLETSKQESLTLFAQTLFI